jgi:tetratricopeptide (TPR) repeat protein
MKESIEKADTLMKRVESIENAWFPSMWSTLSELKDMCQAAAINFKLTGEYSKAGDAHVKQAEYLDKLGNAFKARQAYVKAIGMFIKAQNMPKLRLYSELLVQRDQRSDSFSCAAQVLKQWAKVDIDNRNELWERAAKAYALCLNKKSEEYCRSQIINHGVSLDQKGSGCI